LDELERRGRANGIPDLRMLDDGELREIEPHARGVRALHVPETSVVDFRLVAEELAGVLRDRGVDIRLGAPITGVEAGSGGGRGAGTGGPVDASALVGCAGVFSDRLAQLTGAAPSVRIVPFRGAYWRLSGRSASLVRGLVYPVPDPAFPFLGVHFTRGADEVV